MKPDSSPAPRTVDQDCDAVAAGAGQRIHWTWLPLWAFLTVLTGFEVATHGLVDGSPLHAVGLAATAIAFFVAPDLTFVIGMGDEVPKGSMSVRAVPFYNAMHRLSVALVFTLLIGIGLAPLSSGPLALFVGGLSWMAHIAMDRAAGYGLRNRDGSRS